MSDTRYVTLQELFPKVHRVTLHKWKRAKKLPPPDLIINNRSYYLDRPLKRPGQEKAAPKRVEDDK